MEKLTRKDLYSLEEYAEKRDAVRQQVIAQKKNRRVALGPNAVLIFENRDTIRYQIQEMLRIERVFEAKGIQEELDAYNPLIPDGDNLKATFMIEFAAVEERKTALVKLKGIERCLELLVDGCDPVNAIADEDLERESEEKTSAVHFVRFQLPGEAIQALKRGANLGFAIRHSAYSYENNPVGRETRDSLVADLD